MGPWTLAYHVFGVEPFLLMSIDDPAETRKILRKLNLTTDFSPSSRNNPFKPYYKLPDLDAQTPIDISDPSLE